MNIFNRRELYLTRDLNELNRVHSSLIEVGIEYHTKTNTITNLGRTHGIPFINADYAYEYRVYVRDKDFDRAKHKVYQ